MKSTTVIDDSGCTVPALIGARILSASNETDRLLGNSSEIGASRLNAFLRAGLPSLRTVSQNLRHQYEPCFSIVPL
jgi:hypothetical protein